MEEALTHHDRRREVQARRRPPAEPVCLEATFDDDRILEVSEDDAPDEIKVHLTNENGELGEWVTDQWWSQFLRMWGHAPLTVKIAPTPAALLNPIVLYQIEMLHRVAPRWRLIGYAYADEVRDSEDVEAIAQSAYHEIRFLDRPRPGSARAPSSGNVRSIEGLLADIRRVQAEVGATRPILVRLACELQE
jgi:hypothetical protein